MKLTPAQRRRRIMDLVSADPECRRLMDDYEKAQNSFERLTDRLPGKLREFLWMLPGTGYFLHHRILTLISEHMRFEDEEEHM